MADTESFSDDISALWGAPGESALEPPRPANGSAAHGRGTDPAPTNGSHAGEAAAEAPQDSVARLADALAGHKVDVVRGAQLQALRAEMEEAFTHQLAVALYELLTASNERFASVEDRIETRLHDVAARLEGAVGAQGDRLAGAIEAQQRAAAELVESIRELADIRSRFRDPDETIVAFQREMRHEVGRLGDLVAGHNVDAARRADAYAEQGVAANAQLSERLEARDAAATAEREMISGTLESVQTDLAALQGAVRDLRAEVAALGRRKGRALGRWGRSAHRATTGDSGPAE